MSVDRGSTMRQDLGNGIVGFYSAKFGRGPTKARCYVEESHATVILGDVQTTVERTLAAHGHDALVKEVRRTVKTVFRDELVAIVEQITGRKVLAMHADHDPGSNTSTYVFLYQPASSQP